MYVVVTANSDRTVLFQIATIYGDVLSYIKLENAILKARVHAAKRLVMFCFVVEITPLVHSPFSLPLGGAALARETKDSGQGRAGMKLAIVASGLSRVSILQR